MLPAEADRLLVGRVRDGDEAAWKELIDRYEGRLLAFAESRLQQKQTAEDVVQESFLGFLVSLPNYDEATPLESYLFSITAHKLTDALRRSGRRPTIPLLLPDEDGRSDGPAGRARRASSMARSAEGKGIERKIIADCLRELIAVWKAKGEWERLKCIELLFAAGLPNKDAADRLGLSQQTVANHKQFVVMKLKEAAIRARLRDFDPRDYGAED
ncbi:MAG: sigma-70 family RNA polymerase sigma factor [Planctomycetaceae bacterium]